MTSPTQAEALKLLDDIIADLDMRARMNNDVEDGVAVLDLSNGLVRRYHALKSGTASIEQADPNRCNSTSLNAPIGDASGVAQEPVVEVREWFNMDGSGKGIFGWQHLPIGTKLYAAPQACIPQSDKCDGQDSLLAKDAPQGWDAEFLSLRLGRIAKLAGVAMPDDMTHEQIAEVAGTILGQIASKIAAQKTAVTKWISVDDRLPEIGESVLICGGELIEIAQLVDAEEDQVDQMGHDAGWIGSSYAFPGRSFGNESYMQKPQGQPTHWMPLPEEPDEESPQDTKEQG